MEAGCQAEQCSERVDMAGAGVVAASLFHKDVHLTLEIHRWASSGGRTGTPKCGSSRLNLRHAIML